LAKTDEIAIVLSVDNTYIKYYEFKQSTPCVTANSLQVICTWRSVLPVSTSSRCALTAAAVRQLSSSGEAKYALQHPNSTGYN